MRRSAAKSAAKLLQMKEIYICRYLSPTEDARNLVETATLAGAVIGSGKPFRKRRVAVEKNISDQQRTRRAEVSHASRRVSPTDSVRLAAAGSHGAGATGADESSFGGLHQSRRTDDALGGGRTGRREASSEPKSREDALGQAARVLCGGRAKSAVAAATRAGYTPARDSLRQLWNAATGLAAGGRGMAQAYARAHHAPLQRSGARTPAGLRRGEVDGQRTLHLGEPAALRK